MEILNEKIRRAQLELDRIQNAIHKLEVEKRPHEDQIVVLEREKKDQTDCLGS